jgi:thiosulfate dehydrogenase (quinone) large subunit
MKPNVPPGVALLPLRLFLGATFAFAGIEKLSDPGFLEPGSATYIGTQLEGFADGTPGGWVLETFALPHPELAGVGVALAEIGIGLLAVAGRFTRVVAACGLGLSLLLFLTASWHTSPYFLGPDIVFAFAWLPFVLAGSSGQPALDHRRPRELRLRHRGRISVPVAGEPLTRRAAIARALGAKAVATAGLAGVAALLRGRYVAPVRARAATRATGTRVAASSALARGEALRFEDPQSGAAALVMRDREGSLAAYSAVCTHAGCEVEWRAGRIQCPCHGARFDPATGAPTHGPARRPLAALRVSERDGDIRVG